MWIAGAEPRTETTGAAIGDCLSPGGPDGSAASRVEGAQRPLAADAKEATVQPTSKTHRLAPLARIGFWLCVAIIVWLSLIPGSMRPHTGASGHFEHFIAYAGTGFLFAPGSTLRQRLAAAIGLAALSASVEIAQLFIPGRTGEFGGFFYSSLGAFLGLLLGAAIWSLWRRRA